MDQVADVDFPELPLIEGLFWHIGTYRWIRRLRRRVLDLLIVTPLVVTGAVWEWGREDVRPLPPGWVEAPAHSWAVVGQPRGHGPQWLQLEAVLSTINGWINASHAAAWFPVLAGLVVHLLLRGRLTHMFQAENVLFDDLDRSATRRDWLRIARSIVLVPGAAVAAAVYLLWNGYGSWSSRYAPLLVGIAAALVVGRAQERLRRRPLTVAGFRVPARVLATPCGRRAVRDVAFQHSMVQAGMGWWQVQVEVDGVPLEPYPDDDAGPEAVRDGRREWLLRRARDFRSAGGAKSLAWFTAWAVDTCVHLGDLDTVEDLIRHAEQTPGVISAGSYCAAEAAFLEGIGATEMAADRWRDALSAKGRTPLALRMMAERRSRTGPTLPAPSLWRFMRLAWSDAGQLLPMELSARLRADWAPEQA